MESVQACHELMYSLGLQHIGVTNSPSRGMAALLQVLGDYVVHGPWLSAVPLGKITL